MALKKDKQKVLGEVFDDNRVKEFLDVADQDGVNTDYTALERAYRGMKAENFASFVNFFKDAGRDLNATNQEGKTLIQVISDHRLSNEYTAILKNAGANY